MGVKENVMEKFQSHFAECDYGETYALVNEDLSDYPYSKMAIGSDWTDTTYVIKMKYD